MDLLGSILNSMDKPPAIGNKERITMKKQKEQTEKHEAANKEKLKRFREKIEDEVNKFIEDSERHKHKFETMEKVFRTIAHDVAEVAGLTAFSFGEDDVDRYVMVFKKEYAPSDDELLAYRKGEDWDPEKAKQTARLRELAHLEEEAESSRRAANPARKKKHEKRFGKEASKDAEKITTGNRQFGFVSSENKKDLRSIEQTLADIREKKRQKTAKDAETEQEKDDASNYS